MIEPGDEINAIFWLIVAIISTVPFYIFFVSYRKVRSKKLLFTAVAFSLFVFKGIFLSMKLFLPNNDVGWFLDDELWWTIAAVLDIIIVCLITMALTVSDAIAEEKNGEQKMDIEARIP